MVKTQRVVITPGEPAGIGPDLVVQLAQREWPVELVVCADATLLTDRAAMLGLPLTLRPYSPNSPAQPQTAGTLTLLPVALRAPVTAGQLAVENGHYVVETLARACDGCLNGEFAALITGPVHKGVINDAGIPFTGHTEFFEERSQAKKVVMMLATEELRVALATTHLPLRDIADAHLRLEQHVQNLDPGGIPKHFENLRQIAQFILIRHLLIHGFYHILMHLIKITALYII